MKLLYSSAQIHQSIGELAEQISKDYAGQKVTVLLVLKGALFFGAHLMVQLKGDFEVDTITISSYGAGVTSGDLKLKSQPTQSVEGKNILIVEDIVDSGKTVRFVKEYLLQNGAQSVEVATLIDKEMETNVLVPKYRGFVYKEAPFVVGFGFDLNEKFRNLPDVYQLESADLEANSAS